MEEDAKYDPVPQEPVKPEMKPLTEAVFLNDVEDYEPVVFYEEEE